VFFSMKPSQSRPSEDVGYGEKYENQKEIVYPQKLKDILPGTIRFTKDKPLFMSIEASEPCNILIQIKQNYKDGKIPKKSLK
jgi:hypothetical protein